MKLHTPNLDIDIEPTGALITRRDDPSQRLRLTFEELAGLRNLFGAASMLVDAADSEDRATMTFAEEAEIHDAA